MATETFTSGKMKPEWVAKARGPKVRRARVAPFWIFLVLAWPLQILALAGGFSIPLLPLIVVVVSATATITTMTLRSGILISRSQVVLKGPFSKRLVEMDSIAHVSVRRVRVFRNYFEFRIEFALKDGGAIEFPWIGWHDFQSQLRMIGPGNIKDAEALAGRLTVAIGLS